MTLPSPPLPRQDDEGEAVPLCNSRDLADGGRAVGFDVVYGGQTCRAFAIRFEGRVHAYLNRCTHVAMEMDYQENRFFDDTGQWLLCATHGAAYRPDSGACAGGPCRGGLVKIPLSERDGVVHWHTAWNLQPLQF
ncbi:Rieske 2Fe-2S domain-containing protein [Xenophilus sp. Marseille-Q4582]|uniref:Rieske (2Fe-2S) protein n=1 Tax=Xenophilus sp. Marseille-Q4582 TaxID=2866600 RepID=UPI001CE3E3FE|nr:Rieske 2Fe-2S domain-containing protein [Xenophilus sp. Marseille-Q4582]